MASKQIDGVGIRGIACAVPAAQSTLADARAAFGVDEADKISATSGIVNRRIATDGLCASDLCVAAASRLIADLGWAGDTIDALILVTQTPDQPLPATACVIQHRLGLSKQCAAFDVNLGCSGYVYGLWLASSLIAGGGCRRVLLLAGDTISRLVSPQDRSTAPLFGDAGSATALERDTAASAMHFVLGTDGRGAPHLIVPAGGSRRPRDAENSLRSEREGGNSRSDADLFMNGSEVFTFTLREVPPLISEVLSAGSAAVSDIEAFVFHQANRFMLNHLAKRMGVSADRLIVGLEDVGNTSSASIPLAIATRLHATLETRTIRTVLAGFGVGYSWAACLTELGPLVVPAIISVANDGTVAR